MATGGIIIARIFWRLTPPSIKSALLLCLLPLFGAHADITNTASERALPLLNRIEYSPSLTASGQPTAEALGLAAHSGYSRVIFLAFTNHQNALEHEDVIVKALEQSRWTYPTMRVQRSCQKRWEYRFALLTYLKTLE